MVKDFRYALRTLAKTPGFTVVAILALALGSGVNTAIFSVIDAVLLRPLPFPDANRLVQVDEQDSSGREISFSYPSCLDMRARNRSFASIAAYRNRGMNLTGMETAVRVRAAEVNWEFFDLVGARPILGRTLTAEDDREAAAPVIVISQGLWNRKFGRKGDVLGREISLSGRQYKIAGVVPALPEPFQRTEVFIPLALFAVKGDQMMDRSNHTGIRAIALRKAGTSLEQARADLRDISEHLEHEYPLTNSGVRQMAAPFLDSMVSGVRSGLWMLFGAVGFVLLIACVNVANLLLARSSARRREVAVRAALGAGRAAIVRQFLAESLVLSAAGAMLGTLAAVWVVDAVVRYGPDDIARLSETRLNPAVLGFTLALTVISAVLFGLAPAIGASRTDVMEAMRSGGRTSTEASGRDGLRGALLVAEVALAMVLLAGAGLMLRTIGEISRVDPGFDPHGVLAVTVNPRYSRTEMNTFWERALERVRAIPGVQAASATLNPPFEESNWTSVFLASNAAETDRAHMPVSEFTPVGSHYFETMGIRVKRGRTFNEADGKQKPYAAIVNETLARRIWGDRDPIGQRMKQGFPESRNEWCEVIGVVADVKQETLDAPVRMETYLPLPQDPQDYLNIVIRAGADPLRLAPAVEREIHAMDANVPVFDVRTLDQALEASYARQRFSTMLLEVFAAIALLLAAIGIYGVTSYMVARAKQEIGVRVALGARRVDVLGMVLKRAMTPSVLGLAIGVAGSIAVARAMRSMLFGVSGTDVLTLGSVAGIFLTAALLACVVPAWRAMRVDPVEALRAE